MCIYHYERGPNWLALSSLLLDGAPSAPSLCRLSCCWLPTMVKCVYMQAGESFSRSHIEKHRHTDTHTYTRMEGQERTREEEEELDESEHTLAQHAQNALCEVKLRGFACYGRSCGRLAREPKPASRSLCLCVKPDRIEKGCTRVTRKLLCA